MGGDDQLTSNTNQSTVLVGGSGNDKYNIFGPNFAVIAENQGQGIDTITLDGISLTSLTSYFGWINSSHLFAVDTTTLQSVIVLNADSSRYERVNLGGTIYDASNLLSALGLSTNYLGNYTWGQFDIYFKMGL